MSDADDWKPKYPFTEGQYEVEMYAAEAVKRGDMGVLLDMLMLWQGFRSQDRIKHARLARAEGRAEDAAYYNGGMNEIVKLRPFLRELEKLHKGEPNAFANKV